MKKKIEALVNKFNSNKEYYQKSTYDETSTRIDFLNNFFEIFGWDVSNNDLLPENLREVIHEATIEVEEDNLTKKKKPDYQFQIQGKGIFFIEAKKPSVDISVSQKSVFQLRRYGWSAGMQYSILTNFKEISVYDCTVKPSETDDVNIARIAKFHYTEYVEKSEEIARFLDKNIIAKNEFDLSNTRQFSDFDSYFLNQIKSWRYSLAQNIIEQNEITDIEDFNVFIQRFINKVLFLRICEDTNLEEYEQLQKIKNINELELLFTNADKKYNSGIFHLLDENIYTVEFKIIKAIFAELYYPRSPYDFSVIPPSILAKVYDVFLSERFEILNDEVKLVKKPEAVDFFGAVTTPKEIADLIVKEAFEIRSESNEIILEEFKIIDICCGSGIFLLSAYEYLQNIIYDSSIKQLQQSLDDGILVKEQNSYQLSFKTKKELLQATIYGVDIDLSAVEVCKFSLLLSCIRNISFTELAQLKQEALLPNLDNNIKFGNSLVDDKFYDYYSNSSDSNNILDIVEKISPFDFNEEFGKDIKFDLVIGNPPYTRSQKLAKYSPIEYQYFKAKESNYRSAQISSLDKYHLFVERGLHLLRENTGVLGYIIPNRFIKEKNQNIFRNILFENRSVKKIINYNEIQLFQKVSAYTCLLFLTSRKNQKTEYVSLSLKQSIPVIEQFGLSEFYDTDSLTGEPWGLYSKETRQFLNFTSDTNKFCKLRDLSEISVGLQTSLDEVFIIETNSSDDDFYYFSKKGIEYRVEKDIVKPAIYKVSLNKYRMIQPNRMMIFPYKKIDSSMQLIDIDEMKTAYPECFKYLSVFKNKLKSRSIQSLKDLNTEWYRYGRHQSLANFDSGDMIIWSVLTLKSNFVYTEPPILFTGGGQGPYYGIKSKNEKYEVRYIQAILNTPFISKLIEENSVYYSGGYFSAGKQFIENIPIRKIDFEIVEETQKYARIVSIVKELEKYSASLAIAVSNSEKIRLERVIIGKEKQLNNLIEDLYGVK
ncbi:Eco57I restriction-modification methylase domain-containing protein [Streptococcus suis]|uniref:Eco57I restriction-modification methylase domain-containing protein n=1 Tax=Streptococcus suis TaxID=1307 RepID=UPI00240E12C5|nr:N-6 DNA methylase [Streptococcus suis]WFA75359.1 Eco57I restriction-modification methylase domain-containing protein [Streptococcus suis]